MEVVEYARGDGVGGAERVSMRAHRVSGDRSSSGRDSTLQFAVLKQIAVDMSDPRTGLRCVNHLPARHPSPSSLSLSALALYLSIYQFPLCCSRSAALSPVSPAFAHVANYSTHSRRYALSTSTRLHSRTSKRLRRTKGYFRGNEAVSWLVKRYPAQCKDRPTAVEVSDQLANLGTFDRIKPAKAEGFADSKKYIYRFAPLLDKLHIQGALAALAALVGGLLCLQLHLSIFYFYPARVLYSCSTCAHTRATNTHERALSSHASLQALLVVPFRRDGG